MFNSLPASTSTMYDFIIQNIGVGHKKRDNITALMPLLILHVLRNWEFLRLYVPTFLNSRNSSEYQSSFDAIKSVSDDLRVSDGNSELLMNKFILPVQNEQRFTTGMVCRCPHTDNYWKKNYRVSSLCFVSLSGNCHPMMKSSNPYIEWQNGKGKRAFYYTVYTCLMVDNFCREYSRKEIGGIV